MHPAITPEVIGSHPFCLPSFEIPRNNLHSFVVNTVCNMMISNKFKTKIYHFEII